VKRKKKRTFLCKEPGGANLPDEEFTITAKDMEDSREQASVWNAVVIREIKPKQERKAKR